MIFGYLRYVERLMTDLCFKLYIIFASIVKLVMSYFIFDLGRTVHVF